MSSDAADGADTVKAVVDMSVSTLFITRLPNKLTSEQLSLIFSSYAPIKSAFIVTDPATLKREKSAVGYVKFTLKADAESCLKEFDIKTALSDLTEIEELNGYSAADFSGVKVEWARKKEFSNKKKAPEPREERPKREREGGAFKVPFDPHGPRTVLLQGLSGEAADVKKIIKQKIKKLIDFDDVTDIVYPLELISGETVASVVFKTSFNAKKLAAKLHNHVLRGSLVTTVIKSHFDVVQNLGRSRGGGRLIVRNLNFDVSDADLRAVFGVFGALHSINLPQENGKNRGFAFVYYINKEAAHQALEKLNGSRIYAGLAAERIASEGGKEGKKSEIRKKGEAGEADAVPAAERGRLVAVDWALSKDVFEKQKQPEEVTEDADAAEDADDQPLDLDDADSDDGYGTDDTDLTPIPLEDCEEIFSDEEEKPKEEKKRENNFDDLTLFIRNISFESTEAQLYDLFKTFGPLKYARIVYDPTTKKSRGTGFVCFKFPEAYETALAEYNALPLATTGNTLLSLDPSISAASRFSLHGRVLGVSAAVGKDRAEKLRVDRDKSKDKKDRRNLYLMREGVIFPTWEIAKKLAPADMAARQMSFDARKRLLRTNPSLYISKTRLSIRQLPLFVTDSLLKKMAKFAIWEFEKEVKKGQRQPLTEDELNNEDEEGADVKKDKFDSVVRQSKILRQTDRIDATTGLNRSKGYGFLQLATHADALKVTRWANANRKVLDLFYSWYENELDRLIKQAEQGIGSYKSLSESTKNERIGKLKAKLDEVKKTPFEPSKSDKTLIIEFSIENAVTVKRREEKINKFKGGKPASKDRDGFKKRDGDKEGFKRRDGDKRRDNDKRGDRRRDGDKRRDNDNRRDSGQKPFLKRSHSTGDASRKDSFKKRRK